MARDMTPDAEEVGRGFVRPFRTFVLHTICSRTMRLGRQLARAFALDETAHSTLWCSSCQAFFVVAEFVWVDQDASGDPDVAGEETAHEVGS